LFNDQVQAAIDTQESIGDSYVRVQWLVQQPFIKHIVEPISAQIRNMAWHILSYISGDRGAADIVVFIAVDFDIIADNLTESSLVSANLRKKI
jgi:hypothetical protein